MIKLVSKTAVINVSTCEERFEALLRPQFENEGKC